MENTIIASHYQLTRKIGKGAFGQIWKGINTKTREEVAVKIEDISTRHQQLYVECKVYVWIELNKPKTEKEKSDYRFPKVQYFGTHNSKNIMVMDLLGPSLHDLWNENEKKFSLKTTLMIADQGIKLLEYIHNLRIIHRDLKPHNFLMGLRNYSNRLHLIDFGLAKKFANSKGVHIKERGGRMMTGTARYASCAAHMGFEQSRKDDLESFGYIILFLIKGKLPWCNLKAKNVKEKYEKIEKKKLTTSLVDLCEGLPLCFEEYMKYSKNLEFEQKPDYKFLRGLFKKVMNDNNLQFDYVYDWVARFRKAHGLDLDKREGDDLLEEE